MLVYLFVDEVFSFFKQATFIKKPHQEQDTREMSNHPLQKTIKKEHPQIKGRKINVFAREYDTLPNTLHAPNKSIAPN